MDQITHQNQPVSHPASLTCRSCIWAGQRAAAGKTTRAAAGLVTRRGSGPASSRNPQAPGAALAWLPGLLLHVARREAGRRNRWLHRSGRDLDGLARQAAAGALEAITVRVDAFRGQNTFSIWVMQVRGVWRCGGGRPPVLADQGNVT